MGGYGNEAEFGFECEDKYLQYKSLCVFMFRDIGGSPEVCCGPFSLISI